MEFFHYFCTLALLLQISSCEKIVITEVVTKFGEWGEWQLCPEGTFVTSMDLTTGKLDLNPSQRDSKDKLGLVDVVLQCSHPGDSTPAAFISSKVGGVSSCVDGQSCDGYPTGTTVFEPIIYTYPLKSQCQGFAIGLILMNDEEQISLDNTAANNVRIFCSDLKNAPQSYVEGYGEYEGEWREGASCGEREAICGLQTNSEPLSKEIFDNSAINHFRIKCCDVPNPAVICVPLEHLELIQECDNSGSNIDLTCAYKREIGVSDSALGPQEDFRRDFYENLGYSLEESLHWIVNALKENFGNFTGGVNFDWGSAQLEIWKTEASEEITYMLVPPGGAVKIYQVVGTCGYFSVRTPVFKQVDK